MTSVAYRARGFLAAAIVACGGAALARPDGCVPCESGRILGGLPGDYEAVIVINNATRQRQSSAGRSLRALLDQVDAFPETRRAWRDLAALFEWSGDRAFDELLGRKVTVVVRGLSGPRPPQWALLTEVSADTDRLLGARLKAAPRGTIAGLGVLAVEDGKYELVIGRGRGAGAGVPATSTVLLGPGGDNPLLEELAPSLVTRSGLAAPAPPWKAGQKVRDCDLVMMLRLEGPGEPGQGLAAGRAPGLVSRMLAVTATLEEDGWDAHIACSPGLFWERPPAVTDVRPWSDGALRQLEGDALFAAIGVIGSARSAAAWLPLEPFRALLPAMEAGPCGQLAALIVRPARATPAAAPRPRESEPLLIGGDNRLVRTRERTDQGPAAAHLAMTLALEAEEGCRVADRGDSAVARLVGLLTGSGGATPALRLESGHSEMGLGGTGARRVSLSGMPIDVAYAGALEQLFGDEPAITWGTPRAPMRVAATSAPRRRVWWLASMAPADESWLSRDAEALGQLDSGLPERRLSAGIVRPAALAGWLGGEGVLGPWARRVDLLRWDVSLRDDGQVEGTIRVRMVAPPR